MDGKRSIIDYTTVSNKLTKYRLDTRVFRSFETETDHFLPVSPVRHPLDGREKNK
jgi:hypothetical protein